MEGPVHADKQGSLRCAYSLAFEEREETVRRVESQRLGRWVRNATEGGLLHRKVGPHVEVRGGWILVAEPQSDSRDVHAGLEEVHCSSVAQRARGRKVVPRLMKKVRRHAQNRRELLLSRREETSLSEEEAAQILRRLDRVLAKLPEAIRQAHERLIGGRAVASGD